MKKTSLVVNVHSVVDVITNSSSELFVVYGNKSVEQIEEILKALVKEYNEKVENGELEEWDEETTYEQAFDPPYIYTKEMCKEDREEIAEYKKRRPDWGSFSWGYEGKDETVGKVIIRSRSDNTIPWTLMEEIESIFNTDRYHLG